MKIKKERDIDVYSVSYRGVIPKPVAIQSARALTVPVAAKSKESSVKI